MAQSLLPSVKTYRPSMAEMMDFEQYIIQIGDAGADKIGAALVNFVTYISSFIFYFVVDVNC